MGWCLQTIAMLEAAAGRPREAAMIYGAAEALLERGGATGQTTVTRVQDRYLSQRCWQNKWMRSVSIRFMNRSYAVRDELTCA